MSSPRTGIALRPESARSGCLDTMAGKSLRRQEETGSISSARKSAYMGRRRFRRVFGWFRCWFRG
jgi:hypothetical protein